METWSCRKFNENQKVRRDAVYISRDFLENCENTEFNVCVAQKSVRSAIVEIMVSFVGGYALDRAPIDGSIASQPVADEQRRMYITSVPASVAATRRKPLGKFLHP